MSDFIESTEIPCVSEIQTMGTVMVPSRVSIDRIIIEPRDNPHLGEFRLIVTVDGNLVYSDETPRGRYTVDVEDLQVRENPRQIIAVVVPVDVPSGIRSYLRNESVQITVVGTHRDDPVADPGPADSVRSMELATIQIDHLNPDFTQEFIDDWA
jgi:hypothetical protein